MEVPECFFFYVGFTVRINIYISQLKKCRISSEGLFYFIFVPGAADYSAFPMLLKQLMTPLITQLLDRRSSVVKQVQSLVVHVCNSTFFRCWRKDNSSYTIRVLQSDLQINKIAMIVPC